MSTSSDVFAAFSEDQTEHLTGLSKSQLRYWDKTQFYRPSYVEENRRVAFSRIYSFSDIVALRVLSTLRNQYGVSLQHLRDVSIRLSQSQVGRWTGVHLWVVNKKVIWQEPETRRPQEVLSKQYIVPVSLEVEVNATKQVVETFIKRRDEKERGMIKKSRYINHNTLVIAGTRIPVSAIKNFAAAGYNSKQILMEYPDLTMVDVNAALNYEFTSTAA